MAYRAVLLTLLACARGAVPEMDDTQQMRINRMSALVSSKNDWHGVGMSTLDRDAIMMQPLMDEAEQKVKEQDAEQAKAKPLEKYQAGLERLANDADNYSGIADYPKVSFSADVSQPAATSEDGTSKSAADSWTSMKKEAAMATALSPLEDAAKQVGEFKTALAESHTENHSQKKVEKPVEKKIAGNFKVHVDPARIHRLLSKSAKAVKAPPMAMH